MAIAITGCGSVGPWGLGISQLFTRLLAGVQPSSSTGAGTSDAGGGDRSIVRADLAAVAQALADERTRDLNSETRMSLVAAREAIHGAALTGERLERDATGIAVSTRYAGLNDYVAILDAGRTGGRVNPSQGPQAGLNAPAAHLSIRLGAAGPNATFSSGSVGGLDALSWAMGELEQGGAEAIIACGVDVIPPAAARPLREGASSSVTRPFDRDRQGPLLSEMAVALVLEDEGRARRRGVEPLALLTPVARAFSTTRTPSEISTRALSTALENGPRPRELAACLAGANGSKVGDAAEATVLSALLGTQTPVSAIKGGLGEAPGADSVAQLAVAACSFARGMLPPTAGHQHADPELPQLAITTRARPISPGPIVAHSWDTDRAGALIVLPPRVGRRL